MSRRICLGLCFGALIAVAGVGSLAAEEPQPEGKQAESQKARTLAVFRFSGALAERPQGEDFPFAVDSGGSLKDLVDRLRKAAKDENIAAVVILCEDAQFGTAQIEEVRRALGEVKQAGKEIHAHVDSLSTAHFVLLSSATRISAVPTADVMITGMYSEAPYLRSLLDKVGVQPDFFTCGEYKSAAEMFMRDAPSEEARQNRAALLDGVFATYVQLIADGRQQSVETVKQWIDQGLYTAETARDSGILDAVEHRQEFEATLKKKFGDDLKFDKRYGKKKPLEVDLSSPFGLLKFYGELLAGAKPSSSSKDAVAIVYVEGPIMTGSPASDPFSFASLGGAAYSTPIRNALDKAARDKSIKAVVLRVNSPGGSAVASEIILDATRRVREQKPLVVSMGDVAGSGGYYVACGTDTIFANESTVTGSIGVVTGKLATEGLWDKLGVHWEEQQRGARAGMLYSGRAFTDEERAELQAWMDKIYGVFKGHVLAARKERLKKPIEDLAGGRVYTGRQALEMGLIDKIGGLEEALQFAAEQAGVKDYEVRTLPRPVSFLEALLGETRDTADNQHLELQEPAAAGWAGRAAVLAGESLSYLETVDPRRAGALKTALVQLLILDRERVALTMPPLQLRVQ